MARGPRVKDPSFDLSPGVEELSDEDARKVIGGVTRSVFIALAEMRGSLPRPADIPGPLPKPADLPGPLPDTFQRAFRR